MKPPSEALDTVRKRVASSRSVIGGSEIAPSAPKEFCPLLTVRLSSALKEPASSSEAIIAFEKSSPGFGSAVSQVSQVKSLSRSTCSVQGGV